MTTLIGIAAILLGLFAWIGQSMAFFAPTLATRLGLMEPKADMDDTLYIVEGRAEGLNDTLLTWTFPLSGLLMLLENPLWPYLALVGGGMYLYLSGLIVFTRVFLKKEGKKIGSPATVRVVYIFSTLWALAAIAMMVLSFNHLSAGSPV